MEIGTRLIGVVLHILHWILMPLFWLVSRRRPARVLPPIKDPLLLESAISIARKIRTGEVTSKQVVLAYIDRITEVNPYLNAVVENRFDAALEDAEAVDKRLANLKEVDLDDLEKQFPFLGVPFTVKESCSLAGMSNSVGCVDVSGRKASVDGEVVSKLRSAGAIPLLVSNTPELCLGWETSNLLNGTTNNPYCLNRTPGGSSGGEAALMASGASILSVASDVAGSIRLPAAFTGIFGHKPTPGIISIEGHIPTLNDEIFSKFLNVGPLVRKAEDLTSVVSVMAGENAHKLRLSVPVDLTKLNVFYMTEATYSPALLNVDTCIKTGIKSAVQYLHEECGATVREEKFKDLEDSVEMSVSVFFTMKDIPNLMLDPTNPKHEKSLLGELLKYMFGFGTRSLQALGFTLISRTKLYIPDSRRSYYNDKANKLLEHMTKELGDNGVFLYPVFSGQAHYHNQVFTTTSGVMYSMMFNILGMPVTTVPLGLHNGLPVSLQVIAAPNQDRLCIAVAKQLEIGFGGWKPPS